MCPFVSFRLRPLFAIEEKRDHTWEVGMEGNETRVNGKETRLADETNWVMHIANHGSNARALSPFPPSLIR
jgi:hypothetical protein